jgi:FAD/FMN-containing dehydrogenase
MTVVTIERIDIEEGAHGARVLESARRLAAEELDGRTVWCAASRPAGRHTAGRLQTSLAWIDDPDVVAAELEIAVDERLEALAQRLDDLLAGLAVAQGALEPEDVALLSETTSAAEAEVADRIRPDDVVVLHDALSAILSTAVRERGAHVVWRIRPRATRAATAWRVLSPFTAHVDAYVAGAPGIVAAAMPSRDAVTARQTGLGAPYDIAAWSSVLADVVHSDRDEHVGGVRRPRPAVAQR